MKIAISNLKFGVGKTTIAQNIVVCSASMDGPRLAMDVYVANSGSGGTWAAPIASLLIEQYLTDTITRPDVEKRMLEADLIADEKNYKPFVSKRRRQ